ncbi:MAG: hypothetical protein RMJ66_04690 [Bacteroidia bacterium]|nr:hypothetical protein [Bacteroidia bacterium]MDW8134344.1 hypothetical protein [Bacteroidia bacterium]
MRTARIGLGVGYLLLLYFLIEACASPRTSRHSAAWQRAGRCPATQVGNHAYYYY